MGVASLPGLTAGRGLVSQVYTAEECRARVRVMLAQYTRLVATESSCMVEMIRRHVLPAVRTAGMTDYVPRLDDAVAQVRSVRQRGGGSEWVNE